MDAVTQRNALVAMLRGVRGRDGSYPFNEDSHIELVDEDYLRQVLCGPGYPGPVLYRTCFEQVRDLLNGQIQGLDEKCLISIVKWVEPCLTPDYDLLLDVFLSSWERDTGKRHPWTIAI